MKKEKLLKRIMILACMIMIVCINSFTVKAASKKEKALQAYDAMLSKSSFNVKIDLSVIKYQTINCSFAIAYIDKNSIPELIVKNYMDSDHATGYGAIFTYKNGRVKQIASLSLDEFLKYYKKKGVIIDTYSNMGFSQYDYKKISNGRIKQFAGTSKNYGNPGSKKRYYYDANFKSISKNSFHKLIRKYVKNVKPTKVKFIDNTMENRRRYLK